MENMVFKNFQKSTCHLTIAQETMAYRPYFMLALKTNPYTLELNRAWVLLLWLKCAIFNILHN